MLYNFVLFIFVLIGFLNAEEYSRTYYDETSCIPLIVIGSGIAGNTAAFIASRSRIEPIILFEGPQAGGQLWLAGPVENMPGVDIMPGAAIVEAIKMQGDRNGVIRQPEIVLSIDTSQWPFVVELSSGKTIRVAAIILATGSSPRKLGIPGEETYWGNGVSTCAICDCFLYDDRKVAIVGGGDGAVEQAKYLAPYASEITIYVRSSKMRATRALLEQLDAYDNIVIEYNKVVQEIRGDGKTVTHLLVEDLIDNQQSLVNCDGLFVAIGHKPNSELVKDILPLSDNGHILLSSRGQQSDIPGLFIAGDVEASRYKQVGTAIGTAVQAALEAVDFLHEKGINFKTSKIKKK